MKNSPLVGVLAGVIIVLLIVVFSLGYQVSRWNKLHAEEKALRLEVSETTDILKRQVEDLESQLSKTIQDLEANKEYTEELELQFKKLEKLKERLEENLSEELIKESSAVIRFE
jgi:biopolymer transport protein ExbB/TolQ